MAFDPDAYLAGKHDGDKPQQMAFDPDAYLAAPHQADDSLFNERTAKTALENYGDTLSLGYLPQLQSAAERPMTAVLNAVTGNDVKADDYVSARDMNRERIESESAENPKAALLGKVAGVVNQAPLLAGKAVQGVKLAADATKAERIMAAWQAMKAAGKVGGTIGALQNPGDVAGEVGIQLGDRAKNAALGATIGAGTAGAVESLSYLKDGAKAAGKYFGNLADEKAAKVLGHLSKFENAADKGTATQIGKVLREEGAIKPWTTTKGAGEAADRIRQEAGQEIGSIIENATPGSKIDTRKMSDAIRSSETLQEMANTPGMESAFTRINGMLDTLSRNGEVDLKQAQKLRQMVDKGIKFARRGDAPVPEEGLRAIRTTIRDTMNDVVNASDEMGGIGGKDRLLKANKKYSLMSEAGDIADQQIARDAKNRTISLSDTISGVAGAASGGPITGMAMGALNKGVRTFGNSIATNAYGAAEKALLAVPRFAAIAEKNPALFNSFVQRISSKGREGGYSSLMDQVNRLPVSADSTEKRNPANDPVMTDQAAQDQFIKGNR